LPVEGSDEQKRTNEIGMAIPLLEGCDIAGKDITGDALLTQRPLASYIVNRQAHYHFTAKGNQPGLQRDIALLFDKRGPADFVQVDSPDHWRIETRRIWCSSALNAYIDVHHVGQVFLIERETLTKKTGALRRDAIYWHYPHYHPGGATPYSAIRQGDWKLIEFFEDDRVELYHLRDDPGEQHDLAAQQPERADQLRAKLHAWRTEVGAQLPSVR
jgi:hypothetical protein